jgi:ureidoacrylate peracid hydrolase
MHNSYIAPEVMERVVTFRGLGNDIVVDPAKTAHVIVDLQVGFMNEGALVEVPAARSIVDNVNGISQALRAAGGTVIYIQFKFDADEPHYWNSLYGRMTPEAVNQMKAAFSFGAEQYALYPSLDVQPEDLIVPKTRFSAFIPGTCELDSILKARGIDTLIVTGTLTNCCCESTVRDAMQMGYKILFVQDGNASQSDEEHNATLANMAGLFFADVVTADDAIARIGAAKTAKAA